MPTVSEVLGGLLANALKSPRSTVSSILTGAIGGLPILLGTGLIHGKAASIAGSILIVSKVLWGAFFQSDPGKTLAFSPGSSKPEMVASHETPNDPSAIPVPEVKP